MDRHPAIRALPRAAAAAACALCLCACTLFHEPVLVGSVDVSPAFSLVAESYRYELAWAQYDAYTAYTESRIVEVATVEREAYEFGPWEADYQPDLTDAPEDGGVAEWRQGYFITHDWSAAGQAWLTMQPGDSVTINGRTCSVERIFEYPKDSYYEEVTWITGDDAMVLQTCVPGKDYNRIVVAR